jgi:hypothetical protein
LRSTAHRWIQEAASAVLRAIELGQTTLASYTSDLIQNAASTTGAAMRSLPSSRDSAPTSQHLDELKVAADAQIASYRSLGVANPALGAFEAFGKGSRCRPHDGLCREIRHACRPAPSSLAVYREVMGRLRSADALANLLAQIAYFAPSV